MLNNRSIDTRLALLIGVFVPTLVISASLFDLTHAAYLKDNH